MVDVNYGNLSHFSPSCLSADQLVKYLQPSALSFSKAAVYNTCVQNSPPFHLAASVSWCWS